MHTKSILEAILTPECMDPEMHIGSRICKNVYASSLRI